MRIICLCYIIRRALQNINKKLPGKLKVKTFLEHCGTLRISEKWWKMVFWPWCPLSSDDACSFGAHMALSAIFAEKAVAPVWDSLHFQPCFSPLFFCCIPWKMHSWVEKKIFLLLSDSSAIARFCVPIRSPFRSKANCLEMHLKWPHLPLLSKDSKTTTFSSFSSLLEKRKRRKFHWKSLQNRIPQCAKMCTKASRETQLPQ